MPLAMLHDSRNRISQPFIAPRTSLETVVAEMLKDLLGEGRIGKLDNLSSCEGHSLLEAQFTAGARKAFEVDLPVRYVFKSSAVEGVARTLSTRDDAFPGCSEKISRSLLMARSRIPS